MQDGSCQACADGKKADFTGKQCIEDDNVMIMIWWLSVACFMSFLCQGFGLAFGLKMWCFKENTKSSKQKTTNLPEKQAAAQYEMTAEVNNSLTPNAIEDMS